MRALHRLPQRRLTAGAHRVRSALTTGSELPFLGERLQLRVSAGDPPRVHRDGTRLLVQVAFPLSKNLRPLLESWYRRQAWVHLPPRLQQLARTLDVRPAKLTIRSQKTRWGSCSSFGTISLNWRLMLLPAALVDYVLAHELCHLRYLDHSPSFWRLVSMLVPDYAERQARLRKVQQGLAL